MILAREIGVQLPLNPAKLPTSVHLSGARSEMRGTKGGRCSSETIATIPRCCGISPPSFGLRASSFDTSRELLIPSLWLRTKVKPFPNGEVLGKTRYQSPLMFSKAKGKPKHWMRLLAHNKKLSCQAPYLSSRP